MKHFMSSRRPRNKGNRHKNFGHNNNGNRSPHSGGNEGSYQGGISRKMRNNAEKQHEKFTNMAKDAASGGDIVQAEYYYQHADHYYRIMNEFDKLNVPQHQTLKDDGQQDDNDNDDDGDNANSRVTPQHAPQPVYLSNQRGQEAQDKANKLQDSQEEDEEDEMPAFLTAPLDAPASVPDDAVADVAPRRRGRPPRKADTLAAE